MLLPDLRTALVALAVGLAVGATGSWYLTAEYKDSKWGKAVSDQKVEAAAELQAATDRAVRAERRNAELSNDLEVKHEQNQQRLDRALADNRRLARELGGLRDPGRREGCRGTVPAGAPAAAEPEGGPAGARLSAEASEFLLEFARDADRAAEYAGTCRAWIDGLSRQAPVQ